MNTEILKLYRQLDDMNQTKEVLQLKNQIKETLKFKMRDNFLDLLEIGGVVGYNHLKTEMKKAIELLNSIDKK